MRVLMMSMLTVLLLITGRHAGARSADLAVRKTVNDMTLMPGAGVEYTITVENLGTAPATAVEVRDVFPDGLAIPVGMAPLASQGEYDPATGRWVVGDLAPDAGAALSIPAHVVADPLPLCIVNRATVEAAQDDPDYGNNRSTAALRQAGVESCIDLDVSLMQIGPFFSCGNDYVDITVFVRNRGADLATDVLLTLEPSDSLPSGLRFVDEECEGRTTCSVASIPPGGFARRTLVSGIVRNSRPLRYEVAVTATSAHTDYSPDNDTDVTRFTKQPFSKCDFLDDSNSLGGSGAAFPACFIATAAYGSSMHPYVWELRRFRDQVLMQSETGRAFVEFYNRHSPPAARIIAAHPALRMLARGLLWPLVMIVAEPFATLLVLLLVTVSGRLTLRAIRVWREE